MNDTITHEDGRGVRRGLQAGFVSGLAAITCCVSPYTHRLMLTTLVATGAATYGGLFWFTKYLGIWFG